MKVSHKIISIAIIIVLLIIGSLLYVTNILKDESVKKHRDEVSLHVSSISSQVSQTLKSLNTDIRNLQIVLTDNIALDLRMKQILSENLYIRSINILDEKNVIVISSNNKNIGNTLDTSVYYPIPLFDQFILRFGDVIKARDLFSLDDDLSLTPISKKILFENKLYTIVLTINNNYFFNQFVSHIHEGIETLDIIRMDGHVLYSSNQISNIGSNFNSQEQFNKLKDTVSSSGLEEINNIKYISAYHLTDTFPLAIAVRFDYKKSMKDWELLTNISLLIISLFAILISTIISKFILQYIKTKNNEISYKNRLLENQDKIKNAYIVFENTKDGILITDLNNNIIDVNKSFSSNSGYSFEDVYGKNPRILCSGLHDDNFYQKMWGTLNTTHHWNGEVINRNKNGELYTELLTINSVYDEEGKVKNYVGVFTNITKQKEQKKLLREQERFIYQQSKMASMGEMLENIAHQWRQPLSVISTAATGLKMEKEFGVSTKETEDHKLTVINDSAQYLSKTIDDFRDFFKPDKSKEEFFIEDIMKQSLNILDSKFKNSNIKIETNMSHLKIQGYKGELVQVFMNIINNARDALEDIDFNNRFIVISVYQQENLVMIQIKDSAGGIDKNNLDKIFEPYFTTKHKSQGTGIGLYMSEEIITKHMNGTIDVANTSFSKQGKTFTGACFTISLPVVS